MAAQFELKANLPHETRREIDRIQAKDSGVRTTQETNFLTALTPYLTNEVLLYSEDLYIARAAGNSLPTGYEGFQKGAIFAEVDVTTGEEVLYQNVGTVSSASWQALEIQDGVLVLPETSTPSAVDSVGRLYTKSDNQLYFQNGAGEEKVVQTATGTQLRTNKSYSFSSPGGGSGTYFVGGFYEFAAADANLTNAALTQTFGTANKAYGAHAFIVAGAAGSTDGSDLVLTVTGTSIAEDGTRTTSDSEVIVADCTAASTDEYFETTKKWIGQITFTLSSTGGATFSFDFNYGLTKYEDFGNNDFTVTGFEMVGRAGANDTSFDITLYHHNDQDWNYHATAFAPTPTVIANLQTDYNTEYQLATGDHFAYKRTGLSTAVVGSGLEGVIVAVTTGANGSVETSDVHIGVTI